MTPPSVLYGVPPPGRTDQPWIVTPGVTEPDPFQPRIPLNLGDILRRLAALEAQVAKLHEQQDLRSEVQAIREAMQEMLKKIGCKKHKSAYAPRRPK